MLGVIKRGVDAAGERSAPSYHSCTGRGSEMRLLLSRGDRQQAIPALDPINRGPISRLPMFAT